MEPRIVLGFLGIITCTIGANLLLKTGAMVPASSRVFFGVLAACRT
jgi:hypothetical protein